MKGSHWMIAASAALAGWIQTGVASAESPRCTRVTRANLVPCALAASLASEAERQGLVAFRAREDAARAILPANPVLSGWIAHRSEATLGTDTNWSANLAQEVEIGGQRGARRRAAALARVAQTETVHRSEREAAAEALRSYFDVIATREELGVVKRLEDTFGRVAGAARAASERGLSSGVDADVADASFVRIEGRRVEAEKQASAANARLAAALGLAPANAVPVDGVLEPLRLDALGAAPDERLAVERPEVRALEAEARADEAQASVFRRSRVPSPTVSVFAERDGFAEHVFGVGLALPIPLPHPLGRTYSGEIDESEALARVARTRARRLRREIGRDVAVARATYDAERAAVALYTTERTTRAEQTLRSIAIEIESGRIGIRDAVVAQETLVEMLFAALEARRALCIASVDLAYASGVALERGAP